MRGVELQIIIRMHRDVKARTQDYYFDAKRDYENYQYGYLYKADVPRFDRFPPSFCIGLPDPYM